MRALCYHVSSKWFRPNVLATQRGSEKRCNLTGLGLFDCVFCPLSYTHRTCETIVMTGKRVVHTNAATVTQKESLSVCQDLV